jgi:hypothetical protein
MLAKVISLGLALVSAADQSSDQFTKQSLDSQQSLVDSDFKFPPSEGKRVLYADVSTNKQGIHMLHLTVGSQKQPVKLWMSTYE